MDLATRVPTICSAPRRVSSIPASAIDTPTRIARRSRPSSFAGSASLVSRAAIPR